VSLPATWRAGLICCTAAGGIAIVRTTTEGTMHPLTAYALLLVYISIATVVWTLRKINKRITTIENRARRSGTTTMAVASPVGAQPHLVVIDEFDLPSPVPAAAHVATPGV
jgi:hypothetical protein